VPAEEVAYDGAAAPCVIIGIADVERMCIVGIAVCITGNETAGVYTVECVPYVTARTGRVKVQRTTNKINLFFITN
jgi:hypothetical protein